MELVVKNLLPIQETRNRFNPWVRKIFWRRAWGQTPVFLPEESHREEPGWPPSIGLHRVGHDWSDLVHTQTTHTQRFWSLNWKHFYRFVPFPSSALIHDSGSYSWLCSKMWNSLFLCVWTQVLFLKKKKKNCGHQCLWALKFICWNLILKMMVFRGRALGSLEGIAYII